MAGMDRSTGRWTGGWQHTSQSLGDVVLTPLGSRVLRRMYGADEASIVDRPINAKGLTPAIMAMAVPVARWEPRVVLRHVRITAANVLGKLGLGATITWRPRALYGDMTPAGERRAVIK